MVVGVVVGCTVVGGALITLARNGAFQKLVVLDDAEVNPPVLVAYVRNVGAYKDTARIWKDRLAPASQKLRSDQPGELATKLVLSDDDSFGIYYDDPSTVSPDNCRCILGLVLAKVDGNESDLKAHWKQKLSDIGEESMTLDVLSPTSGKTIDFPFRGMLSILIGTLRIYPTLDKAGTAECEKKKMPLGTKGILEFYSLKAKRTKYVYPVCGRDNLLAFDI